MKGESSHPESSVFWSALGRRGIKLQTLRKIPVLWVLRVASYIIFCSLGKAERPFVKTIGILNLLKKKKVVATHTIQEHRLQDIFMALGLSCGMRYVQYRK